MPVSETEQPVRVAFPVRAEDFRPRRLLRNAHLQTIAGNFLRRSNHLPTPETVLVQVEAPPPLPAPLPRFSAVTSLLPAPVPQTGVEVPRIGSRVLCHCHWQPGAERQRSLTVIVLHGLEGSSNSQYVCGNADKLWYAGCNVVRMNMRNCGGTDALSPTLYHSGMSSDVTALLHWLVARGCMRVVLAGYSMGGNLVLKSAGELGTEAPRELIGVVAVSPPMDLGESADALHHWTNRIYEKRFLRNLLARYRRKVSLFPAVFDMGRAAHVPSIRDFDERVMTPYCGFDGATDYYARAGAARVLDRIAVPTLILHALDDPFIRLTAATRAKLQANRNLTLLEPEHGGHCAFLENPTGNYDGYWAERTLLRFVQARAAVTAQEVALQC